MSTQETTAIILDELKQFVSPEIVDTLSNDQNLVESGIISSLTFISLISALESKLNREVDFEKTSPLKLVSIQGLTDEFSS